VAVLLDDNPAARGAAARQEGSIALILANRVCLDEYRALMRLAAVSGICTAPIPVHRGRTKRPRRGRQRFGCFFQKGFATFLLGTTFDSCAKINRAQRGSNGKITTSALVINSLSACRATTQLAVTSDAACWAYEPAIDGEVVVLELSSYQTDCWRAT